MVGALGAAMHGALQRNGCNGKCHRKTFVAMSRWVRRVEPRFSGPSHLQGIITLRYIHVFSCCIFSKIM